MCYDVGIATKELTMKTTILSPRTVGVSMNLSELLAGLEFSNSQMYLCMVVQGMAAEALGIERSYIQVMENGYEFHHGQFKGITDQMRDAFAPLLGVESMHYIGMASIQSWARETKFAKSKLLTEAVVRRMISEQGEWNFDSYVFETVGYRRVLLEKLISRHGDVAVSFVLELDDGSPVSFISF